MVQSTLIKQTLTVKKVISKEQSKFGKASIIVPVNGKDEFLGLNDGVDSSAFKEGETYEVEISVSKTGKRYINQVLGHATAVPSASNTDSTADAPSAVGLDRDTRITLMNIGNIAGSISVGDPASFKANYALVKEVYKAEGIL